MQRYSAYRLPPSEFLPSGCFYASIFGWLPPHSPATEGWWAYFSAHAGWSPSTLVLDWGDDSSAVLPIVPSGVVGAALWGGICLRGWDRCACGSIIRGNQRVVFWGWWFRRRGVDFRKRILCIHHRTVYFRAQGWVFLWRGSRPCPPAHWCKIWMRHFRLWAAWCGFELPPR